MDLSELRERVERSRPSEGDAYEQSTAQADQSPSCALDIDDIAQIKARAYHVGRSEGYRDGVDHGRTFERDVTLRKVREAETRGVLAGLLFARETVETSGLAQEGDDAWAKAHAMRDAIAEVIAESYEQVSREGLHGERESSMGAIPSVFAERQHGIGPL